MNKLINWMMKLTACMALIVTIANVNSTCLAIIHQPKLPEAALKYKK